MSEIKSYLGRHVAPSPVSEEEMHKLRSKAWHSQGCGVIFPEDIPDEWLRQGLINYLNDRYGERKQA